jgi:hypothetical protein
MSGAALLQKLEAARSEPRLIGVLMCLSLPVPFFVFSNHTADFQFFLFMAIAASWCIIALTCAAAEVVRTVSLLKSSSSADLRAALLHGVDDQCQLFLICKELARRNS